MTLEGESTIISSKAKAKGHIYKRLLIYLPSSIINDSAFPFREGDKVKIRVKGKKMIIEKLHT